MFACWLLVCVVFNLICRLQPGTSTPVFYYSAGESVFRSTTDPRGLPAELSQHIDPSSGRVYFKNRAARTTTWDDPRKTESREKQEGWLRAERREWEAAQLRRIQQERKEAEDREKESGLEMKKRELAARYESRMDELKTHKHRWLMSRQGEWDTDLAMIHSEIDEKQKVIDAKHAELARKHRDAMTGHFLRCFARVSCVCITAFDLDVEQRRAALRNEHDTEKRTLSIALNADKDTLEAERKRRADEAEVCMWFGCFAHCDLMKTKRNREIASKTAEMSAQRAMLQAELDAEAEKLEQKAAADGIKPKPRDSLSPGQSSMPPADGAGRSPSPLTPGSMGSGGPSPMSSGPSPMGVSGGVGAGMGAAAAGPSSYAPSPSAGGHAFVFTPLHQAQMQQAQLAQMQLQALQAQQLQQQQAQYAASYYAAQQQQQQQQYASYVGADGQTYYYAAAPAGSAAPVPAVTPYAAPAPSPSAVVTPHHATPTPSPPAATPHHAHTPHTPHTPAHAPSSAVGGAGVAYKYGNPKANPSAKH